MEINATMQKFGAPNTVIATLPHWVVLLRPRQVTLGSLVLVCREPATAFSDISLEAHGELQQAVTGMETVLKKAFQYDKINYLMLMMVDPDVHFHVIPRYAGQRTHAGQTFVDEQWPGPPDITACNPTDNTFNQKLTEYLGSLWTVGQE